MVIEVRLEHPLNTEFPITVTLGGIVIEVKLEQPKNEFFPIIVTLFPMFIEVRLLQYANTPESGEPPESSEYPIFFKLSGKVIVVKLEHSLNAPCSILITPFPIVALVSLVHLKNAFSPIFVTESGITMEESCIGSPIPTDGLAKA